MKRTTILASLAFFAGMGEIPSLHAEMPEECRRQCSLDSATCKNTCLIDSRDFDGCLEECRQVEEHCLGACR